MNAMTKIAILTASVLSVGALTACQTTTAPKDAKGHHADRMDRKMTPEQRELYKQKRTERQQMFEQVKKACDNKTVGQSVQIKVADKTIEGTCTIHFKADRKDMKKMRGEPHVMTGEHRAIHQPMRGEVHRFNQNPAEPLTDAKRKELTNQYDQRLAHRQAQQQAFASACAGQAHAQAVQIKIGEKTVNGQCLVRFQPKQPVTSAPTKVA